MDEDVKDSEKKLKRVILTEKDRAPYGIKKSSAQSTSSVINKLFLFLIIFSLIIGVSVILPLKSITNDKVIPFISTTIQIIASLFAISISIILVILDNRANKYRINLFQDIFKNYTIIVIGVINILIILSLCISILFFSSQKKDEQISIISLLTIISCFFILFTLIPLLIKIIFEECNPYNIIKKKEEELYECIQKGKVTDVERVTHEIIFLIESSIDNKDEVVFKAGINCLHDLAKYSINNELECAP